MTKAKVISLSVRPSQVSHLCFEVGGILGELNAKLGDSVTAFDFESFYAILRKMPTVLIGAHPRPDFSRLKFDSSEILRTVKVKTFVFATLRAESSKAVLDSAIKARQNAFLTKYGYIQNIVAKMQDFYTPNSANSKYSRLNNLSQISEKQKNILQQAYAGDLIRRDEGVVTYTQSILNSSLSSGGSSTSTGKTFSEQESSAVGARLLDSIPVAGIPIPGAGFTGDLPITLEFQEGSMGQRTDSSGFANQSQTIKNTDYTFRVPTLESLAQNERAQISLMDEMFNEFMQGLGLLNLEQTLKNELSSIDSNVFRLQIAYLNTLLLSPITGAVTGVYKGPGDSVRAGEPVVRIENNNEILLVAILKYKGLISIGKTVTVNTALFDSGPIVPVIVGAVVAARGQKEDDHWEVIVKCNNLDAANKQIFPIGYHFDYDNTTVDVN